MSSQHCTVLILMFVMTIRHSNDRQHARMRQLTSSPRSERRLANSQTVRQRILASCHYCGIFFNYCAWWDFLHLVCGVHLLFLSISSAQQPPSSTYAAQPPPLLPLLCLSRQRPAPQRLVRASPSPPPYQRPPPPLPLTIDMLKQSNRKNSGCRT